ncbi:LOW QUALITY PROTEIN: homeobox protein Hox-A3-like [Piliocolobus tephrosceles]|uniref:LOW QUALITY PROTEIN: homeobox protein Hox-A3-like n=1 Tax=Piliocolobus tephrosceles TaxID=591936 RepID=UPI00130120F4|nr:LOW QUALITY PROTEIN: homeobox protein Hox-A3-like [Piliocolobus tephrosceles]
MTHSLRNSSRDCSSWTGSSKAQGPQLPLEPPQEPQPPLEHPQEPQPPLEPPQEPQPPLEPPQEHSPPWSLHRSHSPPWNLHRSHSPPCHSWSRNRLAHSSTRVCSSRQAHSSRSHSPHSRSHSPHSWSRSPHSRSHSPHSRSHSLQSSHSSPWFWWIEGGAGRGAGEREVQVWSSLSPGSLYSCPGSGERLGTGHFLVPACATGPAVPPAAARCRCGAGSAPAWPAQGLPYSCTCGRQRPFQGRCAEEDAPPGCRAQPGKRQLHSGAGPLDAKESPRRAGNGIAICSRDPNTCECPEPSQRAPGHGVDTGWHSVTLPA